MRGGVNPKSMQTLAIEKVVPDENQPRKYFNAEKMKSLRASIKKYGIINPLVVQEISKGKYLLVDGERRFRAAKELGIKEIPALVEKPQSETERLTRQFNIQEQHEAWTPVEKAVAIENLSKQLGLSLKQTCELLNVTEGDTRRYSAFATLVDKETYIRNEVPLDYAEAFRGLKNITKAIMVDKLDKEFTRADEKQLEHRIIALIKTGIITKRSELTRLKDAFVKSPKSIEEFLKDKNATPMGLFMKTKAKGAYHLRNAVASSRYLTTHVHRFLELRDVKVSLEQFNVMRVAVQALEDMIKLSD